MRFNYDDEIVNSILLIDYNLCELRIINNYFKDLIYGKKYSTDRSFFEKAVEEHTKFLNDLNWQLDRIKVKLELNANELDKLETIKKMFDNRISNIFVTYSEDSEKECLINYSDLCNNYIEMMEKEREILISLIK